MAKKTQTVYKVVMVDDNGRLLSNFVGLMEQKDTQKRFTREYAIGETTLPVPGTLLFAFTSKNEARSLSCKDNLVFEAEAVVEDVTNGMFACYHNVPIEDLVEYFKVGRFLVSCGGDKKNVALCSSIRLLKQV